MFRDAAPYWEAIQQLEPMIRRADGRDTPRAHSCCWRRPIFKNPKWTRRAEGVLQSVLGTENPRHVAARLLLADLYCDVQPAPARAQWTLLYRRVAQDIQPGHAEATARALAAPRAAGGRRAHAPVGLSPRLFKRR